MQVERGESLVGFEKADGRINYAKVDSESRLSQGEYGVIKEVELDFGGKKRKFIQKEFRGSDEHARTQVNNSLRNYKVAKDAGLKVFTTFRRGPDGRSVLMTSGHTDSQVCLGTQIEASQLRQFHEREIESIYNFGVFMEKFFRQAEAATAQGIQIPNDAYFFLVRRNSMPTELDFVIGDLDQVRTLPDTYKDLKAQNIGDAQTALQGFIGRNISHKSSKYGLYFREIIEKVNLLLSQ